MKKIPSLILSALLSVGGAVSALAIPSLDVVVSDADGHLAYRGRTNADGTFASPRLQPGNYVVQLNSNNPALREQEFLLVTSAGTRKTVADAVPGEKLAGGGVAMRIAVAGRQNITGQIAPMIVGDTAQSAGRVLTVNGRRYAWRGPVTGTNLPFLATDDGKPPRYNITIMTPDEVHQLQERTSQPSMGK